MRSDLWTCGIFIFFSGIVDTFSFCINGHERKRAKKKKGTFWTPDPHVCPVCLFSMKTLWTGKKKG